MQLFFGVACSLGSQGRLQDGYKVHRAVSAWCLTTLELFEGTDLPAQRLATQINSYLLM